MNTCEILYWTIGIIHSEHTIEENTPIQPVYAKGCKGYVELCPEFVEGLRDLSGFSHIYLIYHFHQVRSVQLLFNFWSSLIFRMKSMESSPHVRRSAPTLSA
jgi:tRNA (Thr-GGU) A37 N-methylase